MEHLQAQQTSLVRRDSPLRATVIMINRNGGAFLREALRTCRADLDATWPFRQDFELLIVDNGSTDDSLSVICRELDRAAFPWRIVKELTPGVNSARNAGLREAGGDLLIFTDSDLRFHSGWLTAYLDSASLHPGVEVFAGRVEVGLVDGQIPAWIDLNGPWKRSCIVVQADYGKVARLFPLSVECGPVGPNMAFRRSVFERVGLFDVQFGLRPGSLVAGAEAEFFDRLRRIGASFAWVPAAVVEHPLKRQQISRRYFLRRLSGIGRVTARIAWMRRDPGKRIFGLTLYRLPELLQAMTTLVNAYLQGNVRRAFYYCGQMSILLGYLYEDFVLWRASRKQTCASDLDPR
jgi:glucosyl-dolichyl phosphate glucuronosyltransferase